MVAGCTSSAGMAEGATDVSTGAGASTICSPEGGSMACSAPTGFAASAMVAVNNSGRILACCSDFGQEKRLAAHAKRPSRLNPFGFAFTSSL